MQLDQGWLMQQGADAASLRDVDRCFSSFAQTNFAQTNFAQTNFAQTKIGLAVSGGGDSIALLRLGSCWSVQTGQPIAAVTVDHGLRSESGAEAQAVANLCKSLGIPHDILSWRAPKGAGNLPAAARDGRYALMADWAKARGIGAVALGHTADDSAETFLMRLGRAAGLDGLAEMARRSDRYGVTWVRPLLDHTRADLRAYLMRHAVEWIEDPSNEDTRYARTRTRHALPLLEGLGLTAQSIRHSAHALRQAQTALAHYTRREAQTHVIQEAGDLVLPLDFVPAVPADVERRLIAAALQWVGSGAYPPRKFCAAGLKAVLVQQHRLTLSGCLVVKRKGQMRIMREYNAVRDLCGPTDAVWDMRWRLLGPHAPDLQVRALGEGIRLLPDWRKADVPRPSLMASPAVWRADSLVAAPLAGYNSDWSAQIVADFASFLLSH
jgi:tRNA(Ile)-lysidine synthase